MDSYLEHVNITSTDVDATVRFLQIAMPELMVRGEGTGDLCRRWVHLGTATSYIAIEDRGTREPGPHVIYHHPGLNHIGFVVADGDAVSDRLHAAGFREGTHELEHPSRRRFYFFDHDDNEYEFVEYLSDDPGERNDYTS